jgi:hypothetical protein
MPDLTVQPLRLPKACGEHLSPILADFDPKLFQESCFGCTGYMLGVDEDNQSTFVRFLNILQCYRKPASIFILDISFASTFR